MKTQAILIAAIALFVGSDAGLIKPSPVIIAQLTKPAPENVNDLTKPAPGGGNSLTKPAPENVNDLTKPAPGGGNSLTKPAPENVNDLTKPAPGPDTGSIKPLPGTGGDLIKPLPGTGADLIKPLPGTGSDLIKPLPGTGGDLIQPLPGTGADLIKPLPGTGGDLIHTLPGTGADLIKPLPGTGGDLIHTLPGTGADLIKPLPGTGGDLIQPLPGTGADLIKPLPGTGGELINPPAARTVLPRLVLSPELANALNNAQNSISSTIKKEAKLIEKITEQSELALDDLYIAIDDDISVQLSKVKLLSVPSFDVTTANPNLEFLNLALDIDFDSVTVGGNFEIVIKNTLVEIPVKSSGEFVLINSGIKGNGKVGLSLQTNSFKTINYDVAYQPTGSYLTVSYLEDNKRIVSALEVGEKKEAKVVAHINRELNSVLNRLVKKRLDDILGGVAVDKLIGETRTAESYREHARALRVVANDYVDEILSVAHSYVVDNGLSYIAIPDIEASFSEEILFITWYGRFGTSGGLAGNLDTLIRTGDISLDYDTNTGAIKVFGSLGLQELYLGYSHYEVQFQGLGPSGTVAAHVGSNSVFLKVDLLLAVEPTITLEDFHIEYANDITIEISGLGILDWLVSTITTWIVGLFNDQVVSALDGQLSQYISGILTSVDPTKFFA